MLTLEDIMRMTTEEFLEHLAAEIDSIIAAGELDERIDEVIRKQNMLTTMREEYAEMREGETL